MFCRQPAGCNTRVRCGENAGDLHTNSDTDVGCSQTGQPPRLSVAHLSPAASSPIPPPRPCPVSAVDLPGLAPCSAPYNKERGNWKQKLDASRAMSHWWRKIQQALPKPSSLKRTARGNLLFLEKMYGEVTAGHAKDVRNAVRNTVKKSASYGKSARDRAEDATSRVGKQFVESARSIPSKAAEV